MGFADYFTLQIGSKMPADLQLWFFLMFIVVVTATVLLVRGLTAITTRRVEWWGRLRSGKDAETAGRWMVFLAVALGAGVAVAWWTAAQAIH